MKGKSLLLVTLSLLLVLGLGGGIGGLWAKEPEAPGQAPSMAGPVGTAFTYQGRLIDGGSPANGTYDFMFGLYDDSSGGTLVSSIVTIEDVNVTNGLLTVQLDFGAGVFTGDARWLRIAVRPGDSTGDFTNLSPRQALNPAPYALALPGLWTQQNATSPNLIGGYSGNSVTSGVVGATISGGGTTGYTNRITDHYGTVGGGRDNLAGDNAGTVSDTAYATVGGGYYNTASGDVATVGGGQANTASGWIATVGGGISNTASGQYATVPGGLLAVASHYGEMAYASGMLAGPGDAQTSVYVMRIQQTCTAGVWWDLYLDGNSALLTVAPGRTVVFDALVVGRTSAGESAGYYVRGVVENVGGTTAFIGTPSVTTLGEDDIAWDVKAFVSDPSDCFLVQVQGNGETIRWVATIRTSEVSW